MSIMKPRPMFSTLVVAARPGGVLALARVHCHRSIHAQSAVLSAGAQWQDKRWSSTSQRARSASTSTASKPPHKTKPTKPITARPAKPISPAKLHTASASPSAAKRTAPVAAPTTTALTNDGDKLNPPSFTYAPALDVPARKDGQNYASYLFSCGKAYLTFYKTGISHTRSTLKHAKTLRARLASQGNGVSADVAGAGILSRSEWQILRRSKRDLLRLPIMGFLILALGEWLPLIVVYLTPVIPEQCRIPVQVARVLKSKEAKRRERLARIATHALRLQSLDRVPRTDQDGIRLAAAAEELLSPTTKVRKDGGLPMASAIIPPEASVDLSLFHLLLLSARLDCHPRILDRLYVRPPKWWLQRSVSRTLAYLTRDDELVRRDGGSARLNAKELERACVERGIDVLGKSDKERRTALGGWYDI